MTAAVEGVSQLNLAFPLGSVIRASYVGTKVSVPVSNYTMFAQFRHFTPVPAGANGDGYSITRLRMLDLLIDRLASLSGQGSDGGTLQMQKSVAAAAHANPAVDVAELAPAAIDALISDLGGRVRAILGHAETSQFNVPGKAAGLPGALMDLTA